MLFTTLGASFLYCRRGAARKTQTEVSKQGAECKKGQERDEEAARHPGPGKDGKLLQQRAVRHCCE